MEMKREEEMNVENLLKLKRYETPGQEYFDAFLDEFHRYQRSEMLPTRRTMGERILAACQDIHGWMGSQVRVAAPAGVAALILCVSWLAWQPGSQEGSSPVVAQSQETGESFVDGSTVYPGQPDQPAELVMASYDSFERDFSGSQFVTGETPVSYDTVIAF